MQKTIAVMAEFLHNLLPPEIPERFPIDPAFHAIADEEAIVTGVRAFRAFMAKLYGRLQTHGGPFDRPKKETHEFSDNANIPAGYPFVCQLAVLLTNTGVHGLLNDGRDTLMLGGMEAFTAENTLSNSSIPDARIMECLRFLTDCGIQFDGIDINAKKPAAQGAILVSYSESPAMLVGLKAIATAQRDRSTRTVHDILLRCDYRTLTDETPDLFLVLKDLLHPLSADVRAFMLQLHQAYMRNGWKCDTYIGASIRFEYFCRSKELWRFNLSPNNGHNLTIKALNTEKYPDIVARLPDGLQGKIAKGYGCGKKMGVTTSCDGGCRGYRIPLNDAFMAISGDVRAWLNTEVACIRGKMAFGNGAAFTRTKDHG
jgi:hypothetical protein